jgi:hypothetical protein
MIVVVKISFLIFRSLDSPSRGLKATQTKRRFFLLFLLNQVREGEIDSSVTRRFREKKSPNLIQKSPKMKPYLTGFFYPKKLLIKIGNF